MTKTHAARRFGPAPILAFSLIAHIFLTADRLWAQDFGPEGDQEGLHYILGAGGFYSPTHEGSNDYELSALPFFLVTYGNRATVDIGGIQYVIHESGPKTLTVGAGYSFGRNEDDAPELERLGDINGGLDLGFGLDCTPGR